MTEATVERVEPEDLQRVREDRMAALAEFVLLQLPNAEVLRLDVEEWRRTGLRYRVILRSSSESSIAGLTNQADRPVPFGVALTAELVDGHRCVLGPGRLREFGRQSDPVLVLVVDHRQWLVRAGWLSEGRRRDDDAVEVPVDIVDLESETFVQVVQRGLATSSGLLPARQSPESR